MQYGKEKSRASPIINLSSSEKASASSFACIIEGNMPIISNITNDSKMEIAIKQGIISRSNINDNYAEEYLHWQPKTTLKGGFQKLLAWHLDERLPYGS